MWLEILEALVLAGSRSDEVLDAVRHAEDYDTAELGRTSGIGRMSALGLCTGFDEGLHRQWGGQSMRLLQHGG